MPRWPLSVSRASAQRRGIMKKPWQIFHDRSLFLRSFWSLVLMVFEYCSALWCSAADSHLKLLDRVVVLDLGGGWMICLFSIFQVHFVSCQLNFIVLFPFLIYYYHILFIIIVFRLGWHKLVSCFVCLSQGISHGMWLLTWGGWMIFHFWVFKSVLFCVNWISPWFFISYRVLTYVYCCNSIDF